MHGIDVCLRLNRLRLNGVDNTLGTATTRQQLECIVSRSLYFARSPVVLMLPCPMAKTAVLAFLLRRAALPEKLAERCPCTAVRCAAPKALCCPCRSASVAWPLRGGSTLNSQRRRVDGGRRLYAVLIAAGAWNYAYKRWIMDWLCSAPRLAIEDA